MKIPKEIKSHCPKCNKHTLHKVTLYKKGKERKKTTDGWRRYHRKKAGYGSQPKEIFRRNAKVNKKSMPILKCSECGNKKHGRSFRVKKFEIVAK